MTPFAKVEIPLVMDEVLLKGKEKHSFSKPQRYAQDFMNGEFAAVTLENLMVDKAVSETITNKLPEWLLNIEVPTVSILEAVAPVNDNPVIAPHVDYNRKCALNFYLEANQEVTRFFKWDRQAKQCYEVANFVANPKDIWLLDTSEIHAVSMVPGKKRRVLSFSFLSTSYTAIIKNYSEAKKLFGGTDV